MSNLTKILLSVGTVAAGVILVDQLRKRGLIGSL